MGIAEQATTDPCTDEDVVTQVLEGETAFFEVLMRRYNQRLYRILRCILSDDAEVEDVMQEAYVRAYLHLAELKGRKKFSQWLTRIAIREALARKERDGRFEPLDDIAGPQGDSRIRLVSTAPNPEEYASTCEAGTLLEAAITALPEKLRTVIMMRDIEGMSVEETAGCVGISKMNVKVRLHRARALVRRELYARVRAQSLAAFSFLGSRCDRIVEAVLDRIARLENNKAVAASPAK